MFEKVTHCAFSDESGHGRYQSIGMVSIPFDNLSIIESTFVAICSKHGFNNLTKVKWHKLRSADLRFCLLDIMDLVTKCAINGGLRIDVLVWDNQDSRQNVSGRDDGRNLAIMYYHLLHDVFMKRWPEGAVWELYPDRNNIINWETLVEILNHKGLIVSKSEPDNFGRIKINLINRYELKIIESTPTISPLIQLADIFTGMASYSRNKFETFEEWELTNDVQSRLIPLENEINLSRRDKERCSIMNSFKKSCDRNKLGVSLGKTRGFKTWQPRNPINFWFYEPQHENDTAPTH